MRLLLPLLFFLASPFSWGVQDCRSGYTRFVPIERLRGSEILRLVAEAGGHGPAVEIPSSYASGLSAPGPQNTADVRARIETRLIQAGYKIVRPLGEGGLGSVFLVKKDGREFALKALLEVTSKNAKSLVEEAELMKRVVETVGSKEPRYFLEGKVVRLPKDGNLTAEPVIEMEYFKDAKTLSQMIQEGAFEKDPGAADEVSRQLMVAMTKAHSVGVIHSDLKPANVMVKVGADGSMDVRVIDWGLGAITQEAGGTGRNALYRPGFGLGTPQFMSSGQWEAKAVAPVFDVHALRIIDHLMRVGDLQSPGDSSVVRNVTANFSYGSPARALDGKDTSSTRERRLLSAEWSSLPQTVTDRQEMIRRARSDPESDYLAWYGKKLGSIPANAAALDILASRYLAENLEHLKLDPYQLDLIAQAAYVCWAKSADTRSLGAQIGVFDPAPNLFYSNFEQSVRRLHAGGELFSPESYRQRARQLQGRP